MGGVRFLRSLGYPYLMERYLTVFFISREYVLTYHLFQYILRYTLFAPCYFLIESLRSVYLFLFSCPEAEVMGYEAKLRLILCFTFPPQVYLMMREHI